MQLRIPRDIFDNPKPPQIFLCNTRKKILGELPAYDRNLDAKWGSYGELTFSIDRQYVDVLTGETKVHPLFDKTEGLRKVYVRNVGYFIIQDPNTIYGEGDSKTLTCFSVEYETSSKLLENFYVNNGEVDSIEVTYAASLYGEGYPQTTNDLYELAQADKYDKYEKYYIKEYTDNDSHIFTQIQISDEVIYATHFGNGANAGIPLYKKKYPNVQFYNPNKSELSLLHCVFKKIPEWRIGYVDPKLWLKERTFSEERISVYDFLMNNVQDTFKCVVEWDIINYTVNFYEEAEDGITEESTVQTRFDTDVYISRENLTNEINVRYSSDDIKTKLRVSGAEDLDIREVNLGSNYIMNLDFFYTLDWMELDLYEAYGNYLQAVKDSTPDYTEASQGRVAAYNRWNEEMNTIPVDAGVVLVGDKFKKLYCMHEPVNKENADIDEIIQKVKNRLARYHVNEDREASKIDNVLLKLTNNNSDAATIRVFNNAPEGQQNDYQIKLLIIRASGEYTTERNYTIKQWVEGQLHTADGGLLNDILTGYTVTYIGTMGAYFVLAKDETQESNIEDYGVQLLREKHDIYTTIFQTQTEGLFSQEKYQCIVSDEEPVYPNDGDRWLDGDSKPLTLYEYSLQKKKWVEISVDISDEEKKKHEDYQRYLDNYNKLKAVQSVLLRKEKKAQYMLDGYVVPERKVTEPSESYMLQLANEYFKPTVSKPITDGVFDPNIPLYTFTYDKNKYAVYLKDKTPYIAYEDSISVWQTKMNYYAAKVNLENFFNEDQWSRLSPMIREDAFVDDNFLLTGYESEEERLEICRELKEAAEKELKTLSQPSLEFSMNLANILALPEFRPLINQFQLGNFVRVYIRDGLVKRARLLNVHINFEDLSDFSADFGNLITTKSEIDKHAELLQQAIQAGKQVAQASGDWQKAVDKSSKLEEEIANGLQNVTLEVGKANGQNIEIGKYGIRGRKLIDGTTDQYEDEQFALINNKLVFTGDGWKTSKAAFGKFTVDGQDRWGVLSDISQNDYIREVELCWCQIN